MLRFAGSQGALVMARLLSIRRPRIRITSKGVRITSPSVRIGGSVGANLSRRGVSGSVRTKAGSFNTRTGASVSPMVIGVGVLGLLVLLARCFAG